MTDNHVHEWADPYCSRCGTFKDDPEPCTSGSHSWTKACMHCNAHTSG